MLAALLFAMDLAGSVDVSDRTELRVRAPGTASSASIDVETALAARLSLSSRRFHFTLGYTPRFTVWDANTAAVQPTLLHSGEARAEWLGRLAQLSLDETASYGGVDLAATPFALAPQGQPPHADLVPSPGVLQLASSTTTLATRLSLRRWTLAASAGYQLSGGATPDAQKLLPLGAGPFGEVSADAAVTRRDHAVTSLSASESSFSSGPADLLGEGSLGYRRLWSRAVETRLSLGVSETRTRASAFAPYTSATYPVAEGVLERRSGADGQLDARVGVRLGPLVNRLLGVVEERVEASLAGSYRRRRLTARVLASGSRSVPASTPIATSLLAGELGVAYGATHVVAVDTGVRGIWQRQEATLGTFSQGTVFIGVTWRAPPARW